MNNLLVPIDGSPAALRALEQSLQVLQAQFLVRFTRTPSRTLDGA